MGRKWRRSPLIAVAAVVAAGGVAAGTTHAFGLIQTGADGAPDSAPVTVATVTRGPLSVQAEESGTLRYAGGYTVTGHTAGTYTQLPSPGQVITQRQVLYRVDNTPVVLLYGQVPAYRALGYGDSGPDVAQLNADLGTGAGDQYTSATVAAVEALQAGTGLAQTGTLPFGSVVFEPGALRVGSVSPALGATAVPGAHVIQATSTSPQAVVELGAAQETEIAPGDKVTVTLPDNATTPGTVASVGKVATQSPSGPTVQVSIMLDDPAAADRLDAAPVQVTITSQTVSGALAVPVTALLAMPDGGYAVEAVPGGELVPVRLGIFDDAAGLVQVSGNLRPGERIVAGLT